MVQPHLPPEIVDGIIYHLRNDLKTLKMCCLVSKTWAPLSQRYLFKVIKIMPPEKLEKLELWKQTVPDPTTPPTYWHVRSSPGVRPTHLLTAQTYGGRIGPFANGERLMSPRLDVSLTPHIFSFVKSLIIGYKTVSPSEFVNLIYSSPLLEDLETSVLKPENGGIVGPFIPTFIPRPSVLPPLTGTLELNPGTRWVVNILSHLEGGLQFRKIGWNAYGGKKNEAIEYAPEIVERCANTLECFEIRYIKLGKLCPIGSSTFDANFCLL